MHRYAIGVLGVSALTIWVIVSSNEELYPGIVGDDDRKPVDQRGSPWDAVGQVNISFYRIRFACSGVLVAPNIVLTAAHCLHDPWTKKTFDPKFIHFVVGVHGPENLGHATGRCLHLSKDYSYIGPKSWQPRKFAQEVPADAFFNDVAAIVLDSELGAAPVELAESIEATSGLHLSHVSYPADKRYQLTRHSDCHLLKVDDIHNFWLTDCDSHPGGSGRPVLADTSAGPKLAAIMVGGSHSRVEYCGALIAMDRHCAERPMPVERDRSSRLLLSVLRTDWRLIIASAPTVLAGVRSERRQSRPFSNLNDSRHLVCS